MDVTLTQEMIDSVTDLVDGTHLLRALTLSTSGCKRVLDIKARLQLHLDVQSGKITTPQQVIT